jgi:CRISPR-associated endonuclease Csn1
MVHRSTKSIHLFNDVEYTDKEFYQNFPTIYHLRSTLLKSVDDRDDKKIDLRHYYIAIHHILKTRGHFLFEGEFNTESDFCELFDELSRICEQSEVGIKLVDWALLDDFMKGEKYVSDAFVKKYQEHKNDLARLKKLLKKYSIDPDNNFFKNVYAIYV